MSHQGCGILTRFASPRVSLPPHVVELEPVVRIRARLPLRSTLHSERALSAPFEITIVALSRLDDIDFETIIGQGASFRIQHAGDGSTAARQWSGICSHFEQIQAEETGMSTYLVRIVPELGSSSQRQNHRHLPAREASDRYQAAHRVARRARLLDRAAVPHPRFEYHVQYGESGLRSS